MAYVLSRPSTDCCHYLRRIAVHHPFQLCSSAREIARNYDTAKTEDINKATEMLIERLNLL